MSEFFNVMTWSQLFMDHLRVFSARHAKALGVDKAIILHCIHEQVGLREIAKDATCYFDGKWWARFDDEFESLFDFIPIIDLYDAVSELGQDALVKTMDIAGQDTFWIRIEYAVLEAFITVFEEDES